MFLPCSSRRRQAAEEMVAPVIVSPEAPKISWKNVVKSREFYGFFLEIPSGYVKIAIENGPVEIVSCPMKNCDFPVRYVNVYRRV